MGITRKARWWLVFLVLGAIANVGMAWFCMLFQAAPTPARWLPDAQVLWDRYARPEYRRARAAYEVEWTNGAPGVDFLRLIGDLPIEDQQALPEYWEPRMLIVRAGFPFPCVESMNGWGPLSPEAKWGIPIRARNPNIAWVSLLPCRPLAIGFILNTCLYAALLWLVFGLPVIAWRMMKAAERRRVGTCSACGYPIGVNHVCTECGAPVRRCS
jgi:hypothetical protein